MPVEFRWLPLSDQKALPTLRVSYRDIDFASGLFYARTLDRCLDEWLEFDRRESDLIVLSTHWGDPLASTMAHEHRHFQQNYLTLLPRLGMPQPAKDDGTPEGWKSGIRRFYRSQPWEMDALRYSVKVHRDEACEEQWEAVLTSFPRPEGELG